MWLMAAPADFGFLLPVTTTLMVCRTLGESPELYREIVRTSYVAAIAVDSSGQGAVDIYTSAELLCGE